MRKVFAFLYPQEDIIDHQIERSWVLHNIGKKKEKEFENKSDEEYLSYRKKVYGEFYSSKLNQAIDLRYRSKDYAVYYPLLDDAKISELIDVKKEDKIIYVGMDIKIHRTEVNGEYPYYPDQNYILNQLLPLDELIVSGFHLWDCVQRLASRAYERGIKVMVDDELSESFGWLVSKNHFLIDRFPGANPKKYNEDPKFGFSHFMESFLEARKDKPWMFVDY